MRKKIIAAVVLAALLLAVVIWHFTRARAGEALVLYGNVDIRQVSLAFDNSDRVKEMRVEEGDKVKAGQILATLDTRTLQLQAQQARAQVAAQQQVLLRLRNGSRPEEIAQARAQVAAARADAEFAAQQLERLQTIAGTTAGRGISRQDMENAQSRLSVARAQLDSQSKALRLAVIGPRKEDIAQAEAQLQMARADLALLEHRIELSQLVAPSNAVVRSRLLEPGDMASPQRPAYALAITSPKWIRAYAGETELGRIKPGMAASVTTDTFPDQPIAGHVGFISSVAEFTPKSVQTEELRTSLVYEVRVFVDDPDDRLRLGMPATVRFDTPNSRDAAR